MLAHAQELIYQLLDRMPSAYQRQSLKALLELFLKAQGAPLPEHSHLNPASALSRFLAVIAGQCGRSFKPGGAIPLC